MVVLRQSSNAGRGPCSWLKKQDSGSYGPHVSVVAFCSDLSHPSRSSVTAITYVVGVGGYKTSIGKGDMASINNLISSAELREELQRLSTVTTRLKGSILFRRGDSPLGLFLVRKGRIGLCLDCETEAYPVRMLGPGAIAGLPASVSGNPYSLTAEVLQDSELAFVPRRLVVSFLKTIHSRFRGHTHAQQRNL
jgi:hypothetical protein